MATALPLDRVTSLLLDSGAHVAVRGLATTSLDGSSFDAAVQWDALSPGASRAGGLFDFAAGGLRLVEQHPERHEYVLAATGAVGPACAAAGAESPCLVPRLAELAHERLRTREELATTLSGEVQVEGAIAGAPAAGVGVGVAVAVAVGVAVGVAIAVAVVRARRAAHVELRRVRATAREAMRAMRGDPTFDRVREHVRAMLARAFELDRARCACARKLAVLDRGALERKREACARSAAPEAGEALSWLTAECAEAARLESDLASSVIGLQRIESALRVFALRLREYRGTRARMTRADPVDAAASELEIRDDSLTEAEGATAR